MPPRFGDIFVYSSSSDGPGRKITFKDCNLLKSVGDFQVRQHMDVIIYDIDGLYLFLVENEKSGTVDGPFCLTIPPVRKKDD